MDRAALTRVLTYAQAQLDGDVSLGTLAEQAGCSTAYFHRWFRRVMNETPKSYTQRLRLERAALRLVLLSDSVIDVALDCGYSEHATFTRAFRRRFGMTPRQFRATGRLKREGAGIAEVPQRCASPADSSLSRTVVRSLAPMSLAYIRHTGPYDDVPLSHWDRLARWAGRRGHAEPLVLAGIARDAPGITKERDLRFDCAVRVAGAFQPEGEIGHQYFGGRLFAFTTAAGPLERIPAAYDAILRRLLADPTLECEGVPCVEFYRVHRALSDLSIVHTEIGIPVRPSRKPTRRRW